MKSANDKCLNGLSSIRYWIANFHCSGEKCWSTKPKMVLSAETFAPRPHLQLIGSRRRSGETHLSFFGFLLFSSASPPPAIFVFDYVALRFAIPVDGSVSWLDFCSQTISEVPQNTHAVFHGLRKNNTSRRCFKHTWWTNNTAGKVVASQESRQTRNKTQHAQTDEGSKSSIPRSHDIYTRGTHFPINILLADNYLNDQ